MKVEDYPNLLIVSNLTRPIDISLLYLQESKGHLSSGLDKILLEGLFVMAVSSLEFMLSDILKYFLISFPQKLPSSEFKYNKDDFFGNYFNLLRKSVENHVNSLSYKSFKDYFSQFLEYLALEWNDFNETFGKHIKEIKASRNLLLHNNLIVNDQYIESAEEERRSSSKGSSLTLDYKYVNNSIEILIEFDNILKQITTDKYKEYTKINANKSLWSFMFHSPVMPYDDFWEYNEATDTIMSTKKGRYEEGLSSTEEICLGLWRTHFTGNSKYLKYFHMRRFDRDNQEKVLFFLSLAENFSFE